MAQLQATGGSLLMDCLIGLGAHKGFGVPGDLIWLFLTLCMTGPISFNSFYVVMRWRGLYGRGVGQAHWYAGHLFCHPWPGLHKRFYWHSHSHAEFVANAGVYWAGWHRYERP